MQAFFEWISRGCANDQERRNRQRAFAKAAGIDPGLIGRYLDGKVKIGAKNARRIEQATRGEVKAMDLLYGDKPQHKAS